MTKILKNYISSILREEVDSSIIKSLSTHDELNPNIWEEKKLKPEIREKLLEIAQNFFNELEFDPAVEIQDITLTGSISNYNWSKFSDVDLHLRIKFSDVDENHNLVKNYVLSKKTVWNHEHDIEIFDFPVEVYVENVGETHVASGLYSVLNDDWIVEPENKRPIIDIDDIQSKAEGYLATLPLLEEMMEDKKYDEVISMSQKLRDRIKRMRKAGLESGGEFSVENLAFKILRRAEFIDDLVAMEREAYDKSMTLPETYLVRNYINQLLTEQPSEKDEFMAVIAREEVEDDFNFEAVPNPTKVSDVYFYISTGAKGVNFTLRKKFLEITSRRHMVPKDHHVLNLTASPRTAVNLAADYAEANGVKIYYSPIERQSRASARRPGEIPFGKYEGSNINSIIESDPSYILWMRETIKDKPKYKTLAMEIEKAIEQNPNIQDLIIQKQKEKEEYETRVQSQRLAVEQEKDKNQEIINVLSDAYQSEFVRSMIEQLEDGDNPRDWSPRQINSTADLYAKTKSGARKNTEAYKAARKYFFDFYNIEDY